MTRFKIPGDPVAKARPRVNTETGSVYTPRRTKDYQEWVGLCARAARVPVADGDLCVEIRMAVSLTKAGHRRQADIDNCVKSILDGLNGIAWEDDAQVRRLVVDMEDVNAETGEVEVIIESKAVHAET